jgi:hypothetical protein
MRTVNVLIGGSRRTIVLQPLSVERGIGVNLAVGSPIWCSDRVEDNDVGPA